MNNVKAAVFASGTGSNFEAIMNYPELACEIVLLVCDKPGASVIEKAERYGIQTFVLNPNDFDSKEIYEAKVLQTILEVGVEWIFLAGYMRLVGPTLLNAFEGKILNIHPSLLPAFPGKDAIGQALSAGVNVTGVTVHYIDEGMDTGPIIVQEKVEILPGDTDETLKNRIQKVEHVLYPEVINRMVEQGRDTSTEVGEHQPKNRTINRSGRISTEVGEHQPKNRTINRSGRISTEEGEHQPFSQNINRKSRTSTF